MAHMMLQYELTCSICLDIYTCPVMLGCGHNFCRECIHTLLEPQTGYGNRSCPECRATCSPADLHRANLNLGKIAEYYKSWQECPSDVEVPCTYCLQSPVAAERTCLHCEASFCKKHLEVHSKGKEHILVDPTTSHQHRKCRIHHEVYKYFCIKDQACICTSCRLVGDHQDHQIELLEEASVTKKEQLYQVLERLKQKREIYKGRRGFLQNILEKKKEKVGRLKEDVEDVFDKLREHIIETSVNVMNLVGQRSGGVTQQVLAEETSIEEIAAELLQDLLRVQAVSSNMDPLAVLQDTECSSIYARWCTAEPHLDHTLLYPAPNVNVFLVFLVLHKNIQEVLEHLPLLLSSKLLHLKYKVNFILNKATASSYVTLSPDLKSVRYCKGKPGQQSRPQQFKPSQVLSVTSFSSGKHYWEVRTSKTGVKAVGVAYPTIERSGGQAFLGYNEKSWCLIWGHDHMEIRHNSDCMQIVSSNAPMHAVGVFLDYETGLLSFYRLCAEVELLYTITARFTEPLHAAFYVVDSWININPTKTT
ncbi:hypothetical protein GDO81_023880 [Engystomops pustulosus]|uniref:Uncharacterized protein n=1 Tax=Engystomops pustulosus TaxID=76066 RepID=A0AAV6ZNU2_ENGPU|nr:hypothetical protein GDO81_023880 [Engystomops pustulosus]